MRAGSATGNALPALLSAFKVWTALEAVWTPKGIHAPCQIVPMAHFRRLRWFTCVNQVGGL
jgi:hypothetical protein